MQVGIDLGGTKIEAIALDANTRVAASRRVPTPRDYTATLEALTRLVAELESETGKQGTSSK
jgi:fructokinase